MAADVENVVHAAHDPEVAVFILARTVAGEVHAGNLRPVVLHVAVGIAIDGAQHTGPGPLDNKKSARAGRYRLAIHGHDLGNHAGEWPRRGTWLRSDCPRNRSQHDVPGLGLPPRIHNRAAIAADDLAIPHP